MSVLILSNQKNESLDLTPINDLIGHFVFIPFKQVVISFMHNNTVGGGAQNERNGRDLCHRM